MARLNLDWGEGASKSGNLYILPDRTDPTNKADRFHYDYRNRLIKVEHSDDYGEGTPAWSTVVEYYYDGLNRRVKKDLATGTDVIYLYDGWQVLEEREWDTNGEGPEDDKWEPRRQYVYGGTYIDEVLIFDRDTDDDGDCVDGGGSSRHFYCQQANWNVVAVTDSSGDTDEKIKYDAYGESTVTVQGGHSATGNPYLFQGRRWDSEVSLYYFRNRVMSPVLGRFFQRDPAMISRVRWVPPGHSYVFLESTPYANIDPLGEEPYSVAGRNGTSPLETRVGPPCFIEIALLPFYFKIPRETVQWRPVGMNAKCGFWGVQRWGGVLMRTFECKGKKKCCDEAKRKLQEVGAPVRERGEWTCPRKDYVCCLETPHAGFLMSGNVFLTIHIDGPFFLPPKCTVKVEAYSFVEARVLSGWFCVPKEWGWNWCF